MITTLKELENATKEHPKGSVIPPVKNIRDEFAMAALQGLLACPQTVANDPESIAEHSYLAADAMMKQREAK